MNFVELETSDQAKTWLAAEDALGERLVAKVLTDHWTEDNDLEWCWSNGCTGCEADLREGEEGYIWAHPTGDPEHTRYCTLEAFCSERCVEAAIQEWAAPFKKDVLIGYFRL